MKRNCPVLVAAACLALIPALGSAGTTKTVNVDCSKDQSVSEALKTKADELIVVISGMCNEHVVVSRSNVVFRGTHPSSDGFEGPIEGESYPGLVQVEGGVVNVEFENLAFQKSETRGIYVRNAGRVKVSGCWLLDNGSIGFQAARGYGWILDSRIEGNGSVNGGIRLSGAGRLICERCTFKDNGRWELTSVESSNAYLIDSTLSGQRGVYVDTALVWGTNTPIDAADIAFRVSNFGEFSWNASEISGGTSVGPKALLRLDGVAQSMGSDNYVFGDSTLEIKDSVLPGLTTLDSFSNGAAYEIQTGASTEFGTLNCIGGSDFVCGTGVTVGISDCGLCPDGL